MSHDRQALAAAYAAVSLVFLLWTADLVVARDHNAVITTLAFAYCCAKAYLVRIERQNNNDNQQ